MTLIWIILILACKTDHIADACADWINEVPRFCWGGHRLYQLYCPDFDSKSQYTCVGGSTLGCACSTLYRAMDGKCVPLKDCAAHEHVGADIRSGTHMRRVGNAPATTTEKAVISTTSTVEAPVDDVYHHTTKLMKTPDVLELLMMSVDSWVHNECICLKSTHLEDTAQGAKRTIDCYAYRQWVYPSTTIEPLYAEKLVRLTRKIDVSVNKTCNITVNFRHAELVNHTSHTDSSLFGLNNKYDVLVAKYTCVTLAYVSVEGKPQCMIWGTRNGDKIEANDCENDSISSCGEMAIAIENPHTDPCQFYEEI